jgi:cytochrome c oxidase subunit 2
MDNADLRLFPDAASTTAPRVDALYFFLVGMTAVLTLLIAGLILYFGIRYRRNAVVDRSKYHPPLWLELSWMIIPIPILILIFVWSSQLFLEMQRPPADAMDIRVVARQWMWKFQHPSGKREIDELHVPLGRPVRVTMISEDVIHSFFVPAFRVKQDVLPGRYTSAWFEATRIGSFDLFCAEYCGTNHSRMIGRVVVMSPADYQAWLAGRTADTPPAVAGAALFEQLRCVTCHGAAGTATRGPPLAGVFGSDVRLADGSIVAANESYLRESIVRPGAKVVAGFQPLMPAYEGQISEEGINDLIAYIKSLGSSAEAAP